jgi:hypothetical protein
MCNRDISSAPAQLLTVFMHRIRLLMLAPTFWTDAVRVCGACVRSSFLHRRDFTMDCCCCAGLCAQSLPWDVDGLPTALHVYIP